MSTFPKTYTTADQVVAVLDEARILVALKKPLPADEVTKLVDPFNLAVADVSEDNEGNAPWIGINNSPQRYWLDSVDGVAIGADRREEIRSALAEEIDWFGPVYRKGDNEEPGNRYSPLPNVLLFPKQQAAQLEEAVEKYDLKVNEEKSKYLLNYYYCQLSTDSSPGAFAIQQELREAGIEVAFENMPMMTPLAATPNDSLWNDQWDMVQINAPAGWDITTGSNCVTVCILDGGCDLTHPDLVSRYAESGINLNTMLPDGSPTHPHGTPCAGLAAASFNNAEGIAGVAGACRIMPLAFQYWTDVECASGINYAVNSPFRKADVISMSFGVYGPGEGPTFGWNMAIVEPAIQLAASEGVVMCAATGNEDRGDFNRFPARHPEVIAVGAISTDDGRKTPASPDGEFWWGSNYGQDVYNGVITGVSVTAPGVQCPTSDIQGASGYDPGDYIMGFNGTSAATPHVAGLAALVKSKYPTLDRDEIREAIERSAAKVGGVGYAVQPGFPNGTRNQEMGYGRIDVAAALERAKSLVSCQDIKKAANYALHEMAVEKFHHIPNSGRCAEFEFYSNCEQKHARCVPAEVPNLQPCFYLHWGDGRPDHIETEDLEVLILSVCNPYENVGFNDVTIFDIEVRHADGSKVAILPDGSPSAMVVPSKIVSFCAVDACSCCHTELMLQTSKVKEGKYLIRFEYCIGGIEITAPRGKRRNVVDFSIPIVRS